MSNVEALITRLGISYSGYLPRLGCHNSAEELSNNINIQYPIHVELSTKCQSPNNNSAPTKNILEQMTSTETVPINCAGDYKNPYRIGATTNRRLESLTTNPTLSRVFQESNSLQRGKVRKGHFRKINIRDTDTPLGLRQRPQARHDICRSPFCGDGCIIAWSLDSRPRSQSHLSALGLSGRHCLTVNVPGLPTASLHHCRYQ